MKMYTNLTAEVIQMSSGDYLVQHYGKYCSNLGIIVPKGDSHIGPYGQDDQSIRLFQSDDEMDKFDFNLGNGVLDTLRGTFFVSKKGTKLFKVDPTGPHLLLRDDWGGAFVSYRGGKLPTMDGRSLTEIRLGLFPSLIFFIHKVWCDVLVWYSFEIFQPEQTTILLIGRDLYGQPIFGDYVLDPPFVKIFCEERRYRYSGTLYTKLNSMITTICLNLSYRAILHYLDYRPKYYAAIFLYRRGDFRYYDSETVLASEFTNPHFISDFY